MHFGICVKHLSLSFNPTPTLFFLFGLFFVFVLFGFFWGGGIGTLRLALCVRQPLTLNSTIAYITMKLKYTLFRLIGLYSRKRNKYSLGISLTTQTWFIRLLFCKLTAQKDKWSKRSIESWSHLYFTMFSFTIPFRKQQTIKLPLLVRLIPGIRVKSCFKNTGYYVQLTKQEYLVFQNSLTLYSLFLFTTCKPYDKNAKNKMNKLIQNAAFY